MEATKYSMKILQGKNLAIHHPISNACSWNNCWIYEKKILTFNPPTHLLRVTVNSQEFSQLLPNWPDSSALHRNRRDQGSNHKFFRSFSLLLKSHTNSVRVSRRRCASIRRSIYIDFFMESTKASLVLFVKTNECVNIVHKDNYIKILESDWSSAVIVQLHTSCLSNWTVRVIKLALVALEWLFFRHLA